MHHASKSITGSHKVHGHARPAHRFSAAGVYGGMAALFLYSQIVWSTEHGFDHIALRLIIAGLLGSGAAWLLARLLGWLARRRGVDSDRALRRTSFCLSPMVLILLTPLHPAFCYTAILGPALAWTGLGIRRGYQARKSAYVKQLVFKIMACLVGLALALAVGEAVMYLLYHDSPATGHRSPNMKRLMGVRNPHHRPMFSSRGPASQGPKPSGVKRVLVQGDSVASGSQPHWKDAIPNRLLTLLNQREPGRWQMDVMAWAGREMIHHHHSLVQAGGVTDPDVIVYVWYVNDLEMYKKRRPQSRSTVWRTAPFHAFLRKSSYLYRFLDVRLGDLLPRFAPTYLEYLAKQYQTGTYEWLTFELLFQMWLDKARRLAPEVVVFLYPSLPQRGWQGKAYPLAHLHQQIKRSAAEHQVAYPACIAPRRIGSEKADASSSYGRVRWCGANQGEGSLLVDGPIPHLLQVEPGDYRADFRLRIGPAADPGPVARLLIKGNQGRILGQKDLTGSHGPATNEWREVSLPFKVGPGGVKDLRLQVIYFGGAEIAVDRVTLHWPQRQAVRVVDGLRRLKDQETWANEFDAHPNRAANQAVAKMIRGAIQHR